VYHPIFSLLTFASLVFGPVAQAQNQDFTGSFTMHLSLYAEEQQEMDLHFHIGEEMMAIAFESGTDNPMPARLLIDKQADKSYMLMSRQGSKMAIPVPKNKTTAEEKKGAEPDIEATDETRSISGYQCRKIIVTDKKNKSIHWCTKALPLDGDMLASYLTSVSQRANKAQNRMRGMEAGAFQEEYGFPVRSENFKLEKGKEIKTATMTLQNVRPGEYDPAMLSMEGYQIFNLQGGGNFNPYGR
jgi:hypothetical protein